MVDRSRSCEPSIPQQVYTEAKRLRAAELSRTVEVKLTVEAGRPHLPAGFGTPGPCHDSKQAIDTSAFVQSTGLVRPSAASST